MPRQSDLALPVPPASTGGTAQFHCGSLVYSKAGIFSLFTWLLWGDFCFSLMEAVWPSVLPLTLQSLGSSNFIISLFITTIPSAMNFVLNPVISTTSDRYRSRLGRRIPFLLFATPFITAFLILMGFARELGAGLHGLLASSFPQLAPGLVTIGLVGILMVSFRFFELFVNTVYWYLFNDVVPAPLIGRFLGFFRVVGALAGALFNFFVFRYAESHASWIFLGAGLLYGVTFFLMCWNVKEGSYPPPEPVATGRPTLLSYLTMFFQECFSYPVFNLVFLTNGLWMIGYCIYPFNVFFAKSIGLSYTEIGYINGAGGLIGVLLMYPAGALMDRHHPLRVMIIAAATLCLITPLNLIFLWSNFSHAANFWIYAVTIGLSLPLLMIYPAATFPMAMRIFPHGRFGQFCSANAMCGAAATIIGGLFAGVFLDWLKPLHSWPEFSYRYVPAWSTVFFLLALATLAGLFREWKKLGGDRHYQPPIEDKFSALFQGER
ncbi:hypothetical protein BH09VER1_BH09VER1_19130 [soil metagenome]